MASAAGLPGLARETRKRLRRRGEAGCEEASQKDNKPTNKEQPATPRGLQKTTANGSHRAPSHLLAAHRAKHARESKDACELNPKRRKPLFKKEQ